MAALLVGVATAALFVRHSREMLFSGVGVADGGGYVALLLAEFFSCAAAIMIALYFHA